MPPIEDFYLKEELNFTNYKLQDVLIRLEKIVSKYLKEFINKKYKTKSPINIEAFASDFVSYLNKLILKSIFVISNEELVRNVDKSVEFCFDREREGTSLVLIDFWSEQNQDIRKSDKLCLEIFKYICISKYGRLPKNLTIEKIENLSQTNFRENYLTELLLIDDGMHSGSQKTSDLIYIFPYFAPKTKVNIFLAASSENSMNRLKSHFITYQINFYYLNALEPLENIKSTILEKLKEKFEVNSQISEFVDIFFESIIYTKYDMERSTLSISQNSVPDGFSTPSLIQNIFGEDNSYLYEIIPDLEKLHEFVKKTVLLYLNIKAD